MQVFKAFLKDQMNACDSFIDAVSDCKTYGDLERAIRRKSEDIGDMLGIENHSDYDHLETRVSELEMDLEKAFDPDVVFSTMNDRMKFEAFLENHHKFTPQTFELLMQ